MNYAAEQSVIRSEFNGSRRFSNIFLAAAVSLGGFGFFLAGLSSFLKLTYCFFQIQVEFLLYLKGLFSFFMELLVLY